MKKVVFSIAVLSFTLFSCSKDDNASLNSSTNNVEQIETSNFEYEDRLSAIDMKFIGEDHNSTLENYYNEIQSYEIPTDISKDNLKQFVYNQIKDEFSYHNDDLNRVDSILDHVMDGDYIHSQQSFYTNNHISNSLSDIQKSYLDDLSDVFNNLTTDYEQFESNVSDLETTMYNDSSLSNDELVVLYSATQTARHSVHYWMNNGQSWIDLMDDNDLEMDVSITDGMGRADVEGAVAGAVGAAVVNVVPGAGQVSYVGAIVGVGAGNSLATAAGNLWDYIWS